MPQKVENHSNIIQYLSHECKTPIFVFRSMFELIKKGRIPDIKDIDTMITACDEFALFLNLLESNQHLIYSTDDITKLKAMSKAKSK